MKTKLGTVVCAALLTAYAAADTRVHVKGEHIVYNGALSAEANTKAFDLYQAAQTKPVALKITSTGGSVDVGLDLGDWVYEHRLDVVVETLCFSSCANYVFPAGKTKYLHETAVVGWHGGAFSEHFRGSSPNELAEALVEQGIPPDEIQTQVTELLAGLETFQQQWKLREMEFFKKLGVDPTITTLGQREEFSHLQGYHGWYFSLEDMAALGITNVELVGEQWRPDVERWPVFRVDLEELTR